MVLLDRLITIGAPILIGFESDINNHVKEDDVNRIIHILFGAIDLPVQESYKWNQGYLFCRVSMGTKEIYYKNNSNETRII